MVDWPSEWAPLSQEISDKLSKLKMVIFDVDGVFTDGTILRDELGNEQRRFSVLDGHGISRLKDIGILVGVVSREPSEITKSRMEKLKIDEIHVGSKDKSVTLKEILNSVISISEGQPSQSQQQSIAKKEEAKEKGTKTHKVER